MFPKTLNSMTTMRTPAITCSRLFLLLLSLCLAEIIAGSGSGGSRSGHFTKHPLCDVQQRLDNNCMLEVSQGQSFISCCNRCLSASGCVGASVHKASKKCYLHSQCDAVTGCSIPNNDFKHMYIEKPTTETTRETTTEMTTVTTAETTTETITEMITTEPSLCVHGTWKVTTSTCTCDFGYAGVRCDRYYHDCLEIKEYHPNSFYNTGHVLYIRPPNSSAPFKIICRTTSTTAMTYLFVNFGKFGSWNNFNLSWTDYINYFKGDQYNVDSYWMGLENMRIMLGPVGRTVNSLYYFNRAGSIYEIKMEYTNFRVGDASTNYTMTYSSYKVTNNGLQGLVTPGNCLALSNSTQFSTIDVDNDDDPTDNCAKKAQAGWWFSTCSYDCNPLGKFQGQTPPPPTVDGYVQLTGIDEQNMNDVSSVGMSYFENC